MKNRTFYVVEWREDAPFSDWGWLNDDVPGGSRSTFPTRESAYAEVKIACQGLIWRILMVQETTEIVESNA